jgi:RES domain-containing protein
MLIWRLTTERLSGIAFTGKGSAAEDGRWNPEQVAVVYTASSLALAVLECFVNLVSPWKAAHLIAIPCEVPDSLRVETCHGRQIAGGLAERPSFEEYAGGRSSMGPRR